MGVVWGWSLSEMSIVIAQIQHPNHKPILNVNSSSKYVAKVRQVEGYVILDLNPVDMSR